VARGISIESGDRADRGLETRTVRPNKNKSKPKVIVMSLLPHVRLGRLSALLASAVGLAILCAGVGPLDAATTTVSFADATFNAADWSMTVYAAPSPPGTATAVQVFGGTLTPGFYQKITHILGGTPTPSRMTSFHIYTPGAYTPSVQGAIQSLDYSEAVATLSTEAGTYGGATRAALRQNGRLYVSSDNTPTRDDPTASLPSPTKQVRFSGLSARSFGLVLGAGTFDFSQNPDWSANGSRMEFGIARDNSHTYSGTVTRVSATRGWGVTITPVAIQPPVITSQPAALTVREGGTATFAMNASGAAPLQFQWMRNGAAILGATSGSYVITNIQMSDAGPYAVTVSNAGGSVTSATAALTVVAMQSRATRTLPASVLAATLLTVNIDVAPEAGVLAFVVEDRPPTGWTATNITRGGTWDSTSAKVRWGPFFTDRPMQLSYTVVPPATACGSVGFSGNAAFDGIGVLISGQSQILVTAGSPPVIVIQPQNQSTAAGSDVAFCVTATGSGPMSYQWRKDGIILGGATGSCLSLTNVQIGQAGSYQVTVTSPAGSITSQSARLTVLNIRSTAIRQLPPSFVGGNRFPVSIEVTPDSAVFAYAVEETPPSGWTVQQIDNNGTVDLTNKKIKWGPFFDNQRRVLTYVAVPPVGTTGSALFRGTASFDGIGIATGGPALTSTTDLRIGFDRGDLVVWFTGSQLLEADNPAGPYRTIPGATSPYRVPSPNSRPQWFLKTIP
jgi:hypothetical protein